MFARQQSIRIHLLTKSDQALLNKAARSACARLGLAEDLPDQLCSEAALFGVNPGPFREQLIARRLINVFRRLSALVGEDEDSMGRWCFSDNQHFDQQKPADLMQTRAGLRKVEGYLRLLTPSI